MEKEEKEGHAKKESGNGQDDQIQLTAASGGVCFHMTTPVWACVLEHYKSFACLVDSCSKSFIRVREGTACYAGCLLAPS